MAGLDALPGFATPRIALQATSLAGLAEIGRLTHQAACAGVQPTPRALGVPVIPISTQTRLAERSDSGCQAIAAPAAAPSPTIAQTPGTADACKSS